MGYDSNPAKKNVPVLRSFYFDIKVAAQVLVINLILIGFTTQN
jgi:hypothetical protein